MSSKSRKRRRETTEAQRAAARANGAKSQGPVTPEGKARSARNSYRHGLCSPHIAAALTCLYVEDRSEFVVMHEALADELRPVTASEALLAEEMAVCRWRLLRVWAMERALFDEKMAEMHYEIEKLRVPTDGALRAAAAFRQLADDHASTLSLLERYETRLTRQFDRALRRFRDLRAHPTEPAAVLPHEPETQFTEEQPINHDRTTSTTSSSPVDPPDAVPATERAADPRPQAPGCGSRRPGESTVTVVDDAPAAARPTNSRNEPEPALATPTNPRHSE